MESASRERELQRSLELSYRYLNRRERTEAELRAHLEGNGIAADGIDLAITALTETRMLDDARYARVFTEDKRTLEGWGTERICLALRQRGIDRDLIDRALEEGAIESELERAVSLLRSRFPTPPADRRERDRALGVLIRKGYDSEIAHDALTAHERAGGTNAA
jgi:regulatory protein